MKRKILSLIGIILTDISLFLLIIVPLFRHTIEKTEISFTVSAYGTGFIILPGLLTAAVFSSLIFYSCCISGRYFKGLRILVNMPFFAFIINIMMIVILAISNEENRYVPEWGMILFMIVLGANVFVGAFTSAEVTRRSYRHGNVTGKDGISAEPQSIPLCLIVSFLSLGVFIHFWKYSFIKTVLSMKRETGGAAEIVCILFVPFYSLYWWYTRGEFVRHYYKERGWFFYGNGALYLLLSLFGLDLLASAVLQENFNSLLEKYETEY